MVITRTESASLEVLITHTPNKSSHRPPKSKLKSVLPFMRTIYFGLILHQGLKGKLLCLLVLPQECSGDHRVHQSQTAALVSSQGADKSSFSMAASSVEVYHSQIFSLWLQRKVKLWRLESLRSFSEKDRGVWIPSSIAANSTLSSSPLPLKCLSHSLALLAAAIKNKTWKCQQQPLLGGNQWLWTYWSSSFASQNHVRPAFFKGCTLFLITSKCSFNVHFLTSNLAPCYKLLLPC